HGDMDVRAGRGRPRPGEGRGPAEAIQLDRVRRRQQGATGQGARQGDRRRRNHQCGTDHGCTSISLDGALAMKSRGLSRTLSISDCSERVARSSWRMVSFNCGTVCVPKSPSGPSRPLAERLIEAMAAWASSVALLMLAMACLPSVSTIWRALAPRA